MAKKSPRAAAKPASPAPRSHNQNVSPRFVVVEGRYGGGDRTIIDTVECHEVCEVHTRRSPGGTDAVYYANMIATLLNERW